MNGERTTGLVAQGAAPGPGERKGPSGDGWSEHGGNRTL
jgi:hypothetical protein